MKKHLKTVLSLTVICAVVSILLGITNHFTAPKIAEQERLSTQGSFKDVLPSGKDFKEISTDKFNSAVKEAYSSADGGYVFKIEVTGYADGLVIMCGVNHDGKVAGATCIASNETNGAEKTYGNNFKDKTLENVDSVDTISGSTRTTSAYKNAIKYALEAFAILGGAEIETRTEEEILADTLPEAEGKFTIYYMSNDVTVYRADNTTGYVFIVGGEYVPTDNHGKITGEYTAEIKKTVKEVFDNVAFDNLTRINLKKYKKITSDIEYAYKTPQGDYMLDIKAAGYGIQGGSKYSTPSGEYIKIRLFISKNGEILSCVTTFQAESKNIGDACASKEYYSKYIGKTSDSYTEVDTISGATITSIGYEKAVGSAFNAFKILKGVAK